MSPSPAFSHVHIGIAGWSNPPAQREQRGKEQSHLAHYASRFSCAEINSSFYKPHQPATYRRWCDETPPQFRFSVKMPRSITHEAGLRRAAGEVAKFYEQIAPLRPKLKVVLVQLPPSLEFSSRYVRAFFKALPPIRGVAVACEPRHPSWFSDAADATLRELSVSRVAADPARSVGAAEPGGARRVAYFRWHGTPHMYYSTYSDSQLWAFVADVGRCKAREVWCIFDNTARHAAWEDALRFRRFLQKQG